MANPVHSFCNLPFGFSASVHSRVAHSSRFLA
jgi:hypothetical protein